MPAAVNTFIMGSMTTVAEFNEQQAKEADERHKPVIQAHLAGKSQREIAREFGVSRPLVQRILRRARQRGLLNGQR